jgi:GNAT superfamily N-acetyltransferase
MSNLSCQIREGVPDDATVIIQFNAAMARQTERRELDGATLAAGVRAALADPGKARYLVAEIDGSVVGQLMITREWSDWRNGDIWWVQSVYVRPEFRRRGVFRALYERAKSEARGAGAVGIRLYVDCDNTTAQQAYETLGMSRSNYRVMEQMI